MNYDQIWSFIIIYDHYDCIKVDSILSHSHSPSILLFDSYHIISFILIFDLFCFALNFFLFYNFSFLFLTLNIITSTSFFSSFWGQYDSIRLHIFHLLYSTLFYPTSLYSTLSYLITPYLISIWTVLFYSTLLDFTQYYSHFHVINTTPCHTISHHITSWCDLSHLPPPLLFLLTLILFSFPLILIFFFIL